MLGLGPAMSTTLAIVQVVENNVSIFGLALELVSGEQTAMCLVDVGPSCSQIMSLVDLGLDCSQIMCLVDVGPDC